jgi:uncharacterized protein (DUF1684 family)
MVLIIPGIIILAIVSVFIITKMNANEYNSEIIGQRTIKDIWFSNDFESPFVKTTTPFQRLDYFPPNKDFIISAKFAKGNNSDSIKLITNLGEANTYLVYGTATFTIRDAEYVLQLLFQGSGGELFIPYMDATSGNSTYGAGRYLEAAIPTENEIILDFNLAYNPYCAYVDGFSCPFPPKANILDIAIEAGEKTYHR